MTNSTITRKGQITIPKPIRDELGLAVGDRVAFFLRDDEVVIKPLRGTILDLQGSVAPRNRPEDFNRLRESVRRDRAKSRVSRG